MKRLFTFLFGEATCRDASINDIPFSNVTMDRAIDQITDGVRSPGLTRVALIKADLVNNE